MSPELILGIGVAIVAGLILIKLGRQIAIFLLVGGVVAAVITVALAIYNQASATKQVATAAAVASTGQAAASVGTTVMATLLAVVFIAGGAGIAYLVWRLRKAERRQSRQWRPGPNAQWRRQPQFPVYAPPHPYPYQPHQMGYAPPYPQIIVIDGGEYDDEMEELPAWTGQEEGWYQ